MLGPVITVPAITLEGDANGALHPEPSAYAKNFSGKYAHRTIKGGIGHNLPQEAPQALPKLSLTLPRADPHQREARCRVGGMSRELVVDRGARDSSCTGHRPIRRENS